MKKAKSIKIIALSILGLMVAYWLITSTAALLGGNARAFSTVFQMALILGLGVFSWKRPLPGGILIVLFGIVIAMYYLLVMDSMQAINAALALICLPMGISGLLLIEADWISKKIPGLQ
jgi:phosphoglycerol transferase MdoB-like AlkP superfamily enzyme